MTTIIGIFLSISPSVMTISIRRADRNIKILLRPIDIISIS